MFANLLIITVAVVFIIDLSGIVNIIKRRAFRLVFKNKRYKNYSVRPFDCSLCMTFWCGLGYLIALGQVSLLNILYVVLLSFFAENIGNVMVAIKDLIGGLTNKISGLWRN